MDTTQELLSGLPWYFELREEAQQSWHDFDADKLVYISQVLHRDLYTAFFIAEHNRHVRPWIEAHFVLRGKWNGHYCAIIELPFLDRNSFRYLKKNSGIYGVKSDIPVLVEIPEVIKFPEMVGFIGVPTIVRLKFLHHGDCAAWHSYGGTRDLSLCLRGVSRTNGEAGFTGGMPLTDFRQPPCDVIERGAEAAHIVSRHESDSQDAVWIERQKKEQPALTLCCS